MARPPSRAHRVHRAGRLPHRLHNPVPIPHEYEIPLLWNSYRSLRFDNSHPTLLATPFHLFVFTDRNLAKVRARREPCRSASDEKAESALNSR